jgi:transcriptional regulator with PAS, ATPase and Fis domain
MKAIRETLEKVAPWSVPVLLLGESGVGKEVIARELHQLSPRARRALVKVNCVALPSELIESELFGYEKGAFTGAFRSKPGKFEIADGGTVLLDEIGDMDLTLQAKLLQVLQDGEFNRLGGKDSVRVDVRVVGATHRDLKMAVQEGRFREDLYYRLNVVSIAIPPLRERKEEILPLGQYFLEKHRQRDLEVHPIPLHLKQALLAYDWPGNVRELENVMRKYLVFQDARLLIADLYERANGTTRQGVGPPRGPDALYAPAPASQRTSTSEVENSHLMPTAVAAAAPTGEPGPVDSGLPLRAANTGLGSASTEIDSSPSGASERPAVDLTGERVPLRTGENTSAGLRDVDWQRRFGQLEQVLGNLAEALEAKLQVKEPETSVQRAQDELSEIGEGVNGEEMLPLDQLEARSRQAETRVILAALQQNNWNRKRTAKLLQIDYKGLLYKIKKLRIGIPNNANDDEDEALLAG